MRAPHFANAFELRPALLRAGLLAVVLGAAGCTVNFDPEGQPCDAQGGCLTGYHCDATFHCAKGSSGSGSSSSGSSSASSSSGAGATGSSTGNGGSSGSGSGGSSGGACAGVTCPAAESCVAPADGGLAGCAPRAESCLTDADCASGGCLRSVGSASGICAQACDAGSCATGEACTPLTGARGNAFSLCLPTPAPVTCTRDASCGAGLACLPFDVAPAADGGAPAFAAQLPVLFCDAAVADGGASGAACAADVGCASGLCADQGPGLPGVPATGACMGACASASDCTAGQSCVVVRDLASGRHLRACFAGPLTACSACGGCGPDAPDCTGLTCGMGCDPSEISACGVGATCDTSLATPVCETAGQTCP